VLKRSTSLAKHGCSMAFSMLRPSSIKEAKNKASKTLSKLTFGQLILLIFKGAFGLAFGSIKAVFLILTIFWWFLFYSMGGKKVYRESIGR